VNDKEAEEKAGVSPLKQKFRDYYQLVKFTLSFTVVFSCLICYLLAPGISFDWLSVLLLFVAGMLITGSANAINQVVEKDTDAMMKRTSNRPVAAGRMSADEGWTFALVSGVIGVFMMGYYFNWLSAGISAFSLYLYSPEEKTFHCRTGGRDTGCLTLPDRLGGRNRNPVLGRMDIVWHPVFLAVPPFLGDCLGGL
jgi:heme O synthase-like polyprenyltransferase